MSNTVFRKMWYVSVRRKSQLRFLRHTYTKKDDRILVRRTHGLCIIQNIDKITSNRFVLNHLSKGCTKRLERLTVERCDKQTLQKIAFGKCCADLIH